MLIILPCFEGYVEPMAVDGDAIVDRTVFSTHKNGGFMYKVKLMQEFFWGKVRSVLISGVSF